MVELVGVVTGDAVPGKWDGSVELRSIRGAWRTG